MSVQLEAQRASGDRGVTIILFAAAMVGLLLMVALVIDMSDVRDTRQHNKLTTDVAAAAGAQSMAPDGTSRPWRGVCAALTYLQANEPSRSFTLSYRDGGGNPVTGSPCSDRISQVCVAGTPTTWAWIRATDGTYVADIKSGYVTPDPDFAEDAGTYAADNGEPSLGGCDQIAVLLTNRTPALFGGVAGVNSYATTARSVARVKVGVEGEGAPAFLMLERRKCGVLSQQVGVGGGSGIIVEPASATEPGVLHLDSSGTDGTCSGSSAGAFTLYSSTLGGGPGIRVNPAGSTPGVISLRSLETMPSRAWSTAAGVSPVPSVGKLISRGVVDQKYNPGSPYAPTLSNTHATAYVDATRSAAPSGYTTVSTCNGHSATVTAALVFVSCPGGYNPTAVTFSAATDVIFNGPVDIRNGSSLFMPAARRVVVGGNSSGGVTVANGGRLGINSISPFADSEAGVSGACTGREGPAWTQTAQLTIFGGSGSSGALAITGRAALCQTSVYLAGPKQASNATYVRQAITDGSYDVTCTALKPCPKESGNTATNAHLVVSGYAKWSAPNQLAVQPEVGAAGFEDLALWTETANLTEVKSGGVLDSRGVFFLPNGRTEMRSPASAIPRDAQFIGRSLSLLQGTLSMQPTPSNAVLVPVLQSVGMVR